MLAHKIYRSLIKYICLFIYYIDYYRSQIFEKGDLFLHILLGLVNCNQSGKVFKSNLTSSLVTRLLYESRHIKDKKNEGGDKIKKKKKNALKIFLTSVIPFSPALLPPVASLNPILINNNENLLSSSEDRSFTVQSSNKLTFIESPSNNNSTKVGKYNQFLFAFEDFTKTQPISKKKVLNAISNGYIFLW